MWGDQSHWHPIYSVLCGIPIQKKKQKVVVKQTRRTTKEHSTLPQVLTNQVDYFVRHATYDMRGRMGGL